MEPFSSLLDLYQTRLLTKAAAVEEAAIQQALALSGPSSKAAAGASTKSGNKQTYQDDDDAEEEEADKQEQGATEVQIVAEDERVEVAVEVTGVDETVEPAAVPVEAVEVSSPPYNNQGTDLEEGVIGSHALNDSDEVDDDVFKELHVTEEPTSLHVEEEVAAQAASDTVEAGPVVITGDESSVSSPAAEEEMTQVNQEGEEAINTLATATIDEDQTPALASSAAAQDETPAKPEGGEGGRDQAPEHTVRTGETAVVENNNSI